MNKILHYSVIYVQKVDKGSLFCRIGKTKTKKVSIYSFIFHILESFLQIDIFLFAGFKTKDYICTIK